MKYQIAENDVYVANNRHRRVVGLLGKYVYYSRGGDSTHACQRPTFVRWIRENKAEKVHCYTVESGIKPRRTLLEEAWLTG